MLNIPVLRAHIREKGSRLRWFKALPCSCYNPANNTFDRACTLCDFGRVYREQTLASKVRVLIGSLTRHYEHPEFGLIEAGQLTVTAMPDEVWLGDLDKVVLLDHRLLMRERVIRGTGNTDTLAQPYPVSVRVVADDVMTYKAGTDYQFTGGAIKWLAGGNAPSANDTYAVEYLYQGVFWFISRQEERVPRPIPYSSDLTPQRGILVNHYPGPS